MPARILKSLDEFRVRPNLNCAVIRGPVEDVLGKALDSRSEAETADPSKEPQKAPADSTPTESELDEQEMAAFLRMFERFEQGLIDMGYAKPVSRDKQPKAPAGNKET